MKTSMELLLQEQVCALKQTLMKLMPMASTFNETPSHEKRPHTWVQFKLLLQSEH